MELGLSIKTNKRMEGIEAQQNPVSGVVCVAICTRNRTELLRRALDSIGLQTIHHTELYSCCHYYLYS